jgi:hypothetical protein
MYEQWLVAGRQRFAQGIVRQSLIICLANKIWNDGNLIKLEYFFGGLLQIMRDGRYAI